MLQVQRNWKLQLFEVRTYKASPALDGTKMPKATVGDSKGLYQCQIKTSVPPREENSVYDFVRFVF